MDHGTGEMFGYGDGSPIPEIKLKEFKNFHQAKAKKRATRQEMVAVLGEPLFNWESFGRMAFATQDEMKDFLYAPFGQNQKILSLVRKKITKRFHREKQRAKRVKYETL